ncbi:E2F transcription factor-like E2FE [Daucus carota subsp. sativus]|uniref:E2F transcription factor-like E2FE n=1 Tax=Daucus carota subsp. sativus TaxID=79200 RepID=UPI00308299A7
MAQLSANSTQFNFRKLTYCRKEKSFDLLCSNFLNLYDQDRGEMIETHDACARLGVDKRRLRDFIVILESIGLLKKERKNHYSWKGFGVLPKTFQLLQLKFLLICQRGGLGESYTRLEDDEVSQVVEDGRGGKLDNRKENCIELLTQKFVKLFLCSELELISIDEAAILLNGDAQDPSLIQTKVKRFYDIANVLSSMNIIQKTYQPETKRFVFRWIGIRGQAEMATINDLALKTKRTIENEPTNNGVKRHMGDHSVVAPSQTPCEGRSPKKVVENDLEKGSGPDMKKHRFGPFAPTTVPQDKPQGKNNGTQIQDWESLASTQRPQYHQHQALRDLFSHYVGAWNNYHSEVAGKDPAQP